MNECDLSPGTRGIGEASTACFPPSLPQAPPSGPLSTWSTAVKAGVRIAGSSQLYSQYALSLSAVSSAQFLAPCRSSVGDRSNKPTAIEQTLTFFSWVSSLSSFCASFSPLSSAFSVPCLEKNLKVSLTFGKHPRTKQATSAVACPSQSRHVSGAGRDLLYTS